MKKFLSNKKGVSTVEFALTVVFYFFVVCLILEFCRVAITAAYWDLAITESVRIAKNQEATGGNYEEAFEKALKEQAVMKEGSVMSYLARIDAPSKNGKKGPQISVKYVDCQQRNGCIDALLANKFREPKKDSKGNIISPANGILATLAVYTLDYNYRFLTLPFLSADIVNHVLKREVIAVQEFDRDQFHFSNNGAQSSANGNGVPDRP
ncbi:pilus assembly protein [Aggregatibacter actinomycetemcomitans]|nr:pilus assembly protein [Aggregatibacter actinomycetemcomitans]